MGKGAGHWEPGPAQVQHLHLVPLICKYSLTLAGSSGGCGRNTAERHLFSDAVPEDVTVCSVAQVMCHMTGEEEHVSNRKPPEAERAPSRRFVFAPLGLVVAHLVLQGETKASGFSS